MKCEVDKQIFEQVISKSEKVTGKNLSLDVLKNILIIAKNKTITLRSTNLDIGLAISIPARVERDGVVAVSGSILYTFLSNDKKSKKVNLEHTGNTLQIKTESAEARFAIVPHDEFPTLPTISGGTTVSLSAQHIVKGLKSVVSSASSSSLKPELASIYITTEDNKLVFASTDSFRLAEKKIQLKNKIDTFSPILIPLKNVYEIIRNLEETKEDITLSFTDNQLSISFENTYITSRLIDGTFPDYKQIIPSNFISEAVVLKQDFIDNIKVVNVFSNKFNQITFSLQPKSKKLKLHTESDVGEGIVVLDATLEGESLDINFNHKYITDCFPPLSTDSIKMSFAGSGKPLVIKNVGDTSFTYLVMPMNK